jgi:putative beta-barrel porin BBP2
VRRNILQRLKVTGILAAAFAIFTSPVSAQQVEEPDPAMVHLRFGPLWVAPKIALTNLGIDNNVFNEPEGGNPKSDFTFSLTPAFNLWLRVGETWVVGKVAEDINWYQTYSDQRNASFGYSVGWHVPPVSLVGFKVNAARRFGRDRPGLEIDARVARTETQYDGLVELKTLSKTFVGVTARRQQVDYEDTAVFDGTSLRFQLNHVTIGAGLSLRHQLTPLTSIALTAERSEDQFEFSPLRNASSTNISGNVTLDRFALIRGSATVGYTSFRPDFAGLADFHGVTAAANLSYTLLDATRFSFDLNRDVQYSYDVTQPYYVQTKIGVSVTQQIIGPVDVVGRASWASLAYEDRAGAPVEAVNRTDNVQAFGGGVGYHLGRDSRLGFNVDRTNRTSELTKRQYTNLTFGASVIYGF